MNRPWFAGGRVARVLRGHLEVLKDSVVVRFRLGERDVDRSPAGCHLDKGGISLGDRLEVDIAAKVVFLAQQPGDKAELLHGVIGRTDNP